MKKIYLLVISAILSAGSFAQFVPIVSDPLGTSGNIVVGALNYHVSESIYTDAEIGHNNYTSAASAIQQIFFLLEQEPDVTTVNNYRIYMKNVPIGTTVFADGSYSLTGYTLVFTGTYNVTPVGLTPIILTTPFTRTTNTNLQLLIVRADNVVHATTVAAIFDASLGSNGNINALSSRRYNSATAPVAGTSTLVATNFRPLIAFNHTFAVDAIVNDILLPSVSCFSGPSSVSVEILNGGTTSIPAGAAATTLHVRGANIYSGTQSNTAAILPGETGLVTFNGVNFSNPGNNFDTAYVNLPGDGTTFYDTLSTINAATNLAPGFPYNETVEEAFPITATSDLDIFAFKETIVDNDLWNVQAGNYSNPTQLTPLVPLGAPVDSAYYIFDSYANPPSEGVESRLYSKCLKLPRNLDTTHYTTTAAVTFFMNHDSEPLLSALDSLYISVSTNQGITWKRIAGFQRFDATAIVPVWRQERVDLSAYLDSFPVAFPRTIQVGFEGVSKWGNAILLDNINIDTLNLFILPVNLLSFNAQRNGKVNDLVWKTSQETNSSKFIIERSTDGARNFTDIGSVAATGNSSVERSYRFTDLAPAKGINYYRLRIVDMDTKFKHSDIKNVRNLGVADFSFAPNPVEQHMKIQFDAEKADKGIVSVTDMSGKLIYSTTVNLSEGRNEFFIETGAYAPGMYIMKVQLSDDRIVKKFTKL